MPTDLSFTIGIDDGSGVARAPRRRMAFRGTFESVTGRGDVAVRNVSCTGALIEGCDLPAAGWDIIVRAEGLELFGRVIWSDGRRSGIAFDEPLRPAQVNQLHRITPEEVQRQELEATAWWYETRSRFGD